MMSAELAGALLDACDRGVLMSAPPSEAAAGFSMVDAYAVAELNRRHRMARGERALGYKIGFTNRSIWDRYGVHAPIWGPVWDSTVQLLHGVHGSTTLHRLVQPRLEPEVMFGFRSMPHSGMNEAELAGCIEWVAHGFEIVHTHFADWRFAAADTVADFALHGRLFVGPRVPIERFADPRAELAALNVRLFCGDRQVDEGEGALVLDGPLTALRVWIDAMAAQPHGWQVNPGDIVSTGTLTDAWPLSPGQTWRTELSDERLPGLRLDIES
jgi:2-keto-4-pentenoate hydratase